MKIVLHRDRDFLMPAETDAFMKPYEDKGIAVWLTRSSDVESYFAETAVIAAHYGVDEDTASSWLAQAVAALKSKGSDEECRNSKRHAIRNQPPLKNLAEKGKLVNFSDTQVVSEYSKHGEHHVALGKDLVSAVRKVAQDNGCSSKSVFAKSIPEAVRGNVATDLHDLLHDVLKF